jgi:hypothetical protein
MLNIFFFVVMLWYRELKIIKFETKTIKKAQKEKKLVFALKFNSILQFRKCIENTTEKKNIIYIYIKYNFKKNKKKRIKLLFIFFLKIKRRLKDFFSK